MSLSLFTPKLLISTRCSIRFASQSTKSKKKGKDENAEKGALLEDVVPAIKAYAVSPFDESIELVIKTTLKRGEALRGKLELQHDIGKRNKILVFAQGDKVLEAEKAGAAKIGGEELIEAISKGEKMKGFDTALCVPSMLKSVAKVAKELGRRGLMPQAKRGTVVENIGEAVQNAIKTLQFKTDRNGGVQVPIGKASMSIQQLSENIDAFVASMKANSVQEDDFGNKKGKKKIVELMYLKSTFGPAFQLKLSQFKL